MSFRFQRGGYDPPPSNLPVFEAVTVTYAPIRGFREVIPVREGLLLVDRAHLNQFDEEEVNILLARVADRGYSIEFLNDGGQLEEKLQSADSFLVILPGIAYDEGDAALAQDFVDTGGKILLIGDPGRASEINSLARTFGVLFQPGYLYNVVEHDLNFRNIFISDFRTDQVTDGLGKISLYSAGSIKSSGFPLAFSDANTFSSMVERVEAFSPLVKGSDGRVLSISDLTFMISPNNAVWDNDRLIANLADYLTTSERILFE
ncbi:MAG: hypothetical protein IIC81_10190 [Chloroflexi bacterium]|nr:hypothetical protein [Chloroflexota bacterium]